MIETEESELVAMIVGYGPGALQKESRKQTQMIGMYRL